MAQPEAVASSEVRNGQSSDFQITVGMDQLLPDVIDLPIERETWHLGNDVAEACRRQASGYAYRAISFEAGVNQLAVQSGSEKGGPKDRGKSVGDLARKRDSTPWCRSLLTSR